MVHTLLTKLTRIPYLVPLTFASTFLILFPFMAEADSQSCTDVQKQIEQIQNTLRPLEQHQQQLQQHVRTIYQNLFVCQAGGELSLAEQQSCTQLQEEGPKQFQAMIEAITVSHQMSQQLASQTHQVQLACPAIAEDRSSIVSSLEHS